MTSRGGCSRDKALVKDPTFANEAPKLRIWGLLRAAAARCLSFLGLDQDDGGLSQGKDLGSDALPLPITF